MSNQPQNQDDRARLLPLAPGMEGLVPPDPLTTTMPRSATPFGDPPDPALEPRLPDETMNMYLGRIQSRIEAGRFTEAEAREVFTDRFNSRRSQAAYIHPPPPQTPPQRGIGVIGDPPAEAIPPPLNRPAARSLDPSHPALEPRAGDSLNEYLGRVRGQLTEPEAREKFGAWCQNRGAQAGNSREVQSVPPPSISGPANQATAPFVDMVDSYLEPYGDETLSKYMARVSGHLSDHAARERYLAWLRDRVAQSGNSQSWAELASGGAH